jgi:cytochrome b
MQQHHTDNPNQSDGHIVVWDGLIRLFHWTLVLGVVTTYLCAKYRFGHLHVLIGYFLCATLVVRLVWGVVGSRYARFASFMFTGKETVQYLRTLRSTAPRHYVGHNPLGALMVFALLGLLGLLYLTGLLTLACIDFDGPLVAAASQISDQTSFLIRHLHAWLVNIGMVLVGLHLLGVVSGSVQHRENLVKAMLTGRKNID